MSLFSHVFVREWRKNPCGTIACVENKTIVILILISHIWERKLNTNTKTILIGIQNENRLKVYAQRDILLIFMMKRMAFNSSEFIVNSLLIADKYLMEKK